MDFQIKQNDSFFAVRSIITATNSELQKTIFESFKDAEIEIEGDDLGLTISEILENHDIEIKDFIEYTFPKFQNNDEFYQIVPSLIIWGEGSECPCENCGSEMDVEVEGWGKHKWNVYSCTVCGENSSEEPDWDSKPGGHDFY